MGRRRARPRSPTGSAGCRSPSACSPRSDSLTAFADEVRADGHERRRAARHGRLLARAGGAAPVLRLAARPPAPARARLDRRGDRPRRGPARRPRAHAVRRLVEVGRHDRAAVAVRALLLARRRRAQLRRDHRPRLGPADARARARLPARVRTATRTSAGATARCRRSASCRRRSSASTSASCCAVRATPGTPSCAKRRSTPAPRGRTPAPAVRRAAGVWLGSALGALAQAGRDKLTFVIAHSLPGLRPVARAARRRVDRQARTGILPVADEPLGEPGRIRRRPRVRLPVRRRRARRGARRARRRARRRPGIRC